jgi:hypothetical protein
VKQRTFNSIYSEPIYRRQPPAKLFDFLEKNSQCRDTWRGSFFTAIYGYGERGVVSLCPKIL